MTATQRIINWLRWKKPVAARYEAAQWSFDRSTLPGANADARYDMGGLARVEIMRRARYYEKNHPLPNKVLDLLETNIVGTGVNPTPLSSDAAYNVESLKRWNAWCRVADATSRQNFYALQAIIIRAQAVDGEIFVWLTENETGNARLQLIEAHRCVDGDISKLNADARVQLGIKPEEPDPYVCVDGIVIDRRGRPQYYLISDDYDIKGRPGRVTAIPAAEIVHFFEPSRAGQMRGLSVFHPVLPTLHDLDDLQKYEMLAAKDAASRANVVYTENGEIPTGLPSRFALPGSTPNETVVDENARRKYYEEAFGGKTIALRRGDKWTQAESLRPSAAMREFWEYLAENFAKGVGISYAAVQDYKGNWGGAALRGAVTSDNRFYEIRTGNFATGLDRIWVHVQSREFRGTTLPKDFTAVKWQPPRRASVDIGYDSAATINDLRAGIRNLRDVIGEGGSDVVTVLTQRADEMKLCKELEISRGLQPGTLSILFPNPPPIAAPDPGKIPGGATP